MTYHQLSIIHPDWTEQAACKGSPVEWFSPPEQKLGGSLAPTDMGNVARGQQVCSGCPVRASCLEDSDEDDRAWTVRGGLFPAGLSPLKGFQLGEGKCSHGHDKSITGVIKHAQGRVRCAQCRLDQRVSAYDGGYVQPLTNAQLASGLCLKNHQIGAPGTLTASLRCVACVDARRRTREEKERQSLRGRQTA
jgi:hypothetical protein